MRPCRPAQRQCRSRLQLLSALEKAAGDGLTLRRILRAQSGASRQTGQADMITRPGERLIKAGERCLQQLAPSGEVTGRSQQSIEFDQCRKPAFPRHRPIPAVSEGGGKQATDRHGSRRSLRPCVEAPRGAAEHRSVFLTVEAGFPVAVCFGVLTDRARGSEHVARRSRPPFGSRGAGAKCEC